MRVLRLDLGRTRIELHPYVTVVRGLGPEVREELLDVLAGIPGGRTPVGGLIEAHGVLLDLAPSTLRLLDLDQPLDVVVRAGDLPGATNGDDPTRPARRALAEAQAAVAAAHAAVVDADGRHRAAQAALAEAPVDGGSEPPANEPPAPRPDSAASKDAATVAVTVAAELQVAVAALQEAESGAAAARERRTEAAAAVSVAVAALASANERRDPTAPAVVEAAEARLAEAEADLQAVRAGEAARVADGATNESLVAERVEAQAALLALDTTDPMPVQLALDQVCSGHVELLPSPEAEALADEAAALEAQLARFGAVGPSDVELDNEERALARRRVEVAEQTLADLEAAGLRPVFDPDDIADLEVAHLEVLEARDAASKRFGAARAARRIEEVEAAEQAVLDRMGLITYTEFLMGGGSNATSPADESMADRIAAARADLDKAERQLEQREADVAGELARAELLNRRRQVRDRAEALLGQDPGDDLEGALRRHRVPGTDTGDHLSRLRHALEGVGMVLADEDVDERWLTDLARVWLHELSETEAQRSVLEKQIAAIDVRLATVEARHAAPDVEEPIALAAGALEDARKALEVATARLRLADATVAEVEQLRVALAEADDAEAVAAAELATAEDHVRAAADDARRHADAARAAEAALAEVEADEAAAAEAAAAAEHHLTEVRLSGAAALEAEARSAAEEAAAAGARLAAVEAVAADASGALDAQLAARDSHDGSEPVAAEDVEWYLLSRVAAQRSASFAGSVPLVLDDALVALDAIAARDVLDRLERMASTVQLVVVTEDLATAQWAEDLGERRAQVTEAR